MDLFFYLKLRNLENIDVLKAHECYWGRKYSEYRSVIVDNGTFGLAPNKFVATRN